MFRILGPIDLVTEAGPISIGGHHQRALLGALVMSAGHAVPIDHLGFVLWGDDPPRSADNTLGSYVSGIRQIVGADVIVRTDHSYVLDLGVADVDALEFERLIRRADAARSEPAECWELCRSALRLWRGRPFGELADEEPFVAEAIRLDELRLAAMELSMTADLALGRHELVVGELETAVKEYPYRERLWYLLIEALALGDRRVEALRAGAELRGILAEAGIDVDDGIRELESRILAGSFETPT
jgi:DNA-binding SARP family transcriptional activator